MDAPTSSERTYFAAVGAFAVWVGLWGYGFPAEVDRALPWKVPPLHARFIGAMYLGGALLMVGGLLASSRSHVRIALWMASIWTGMLLLVSLLHFSTFEWTKTQVWFWWFAYIVYPVAGALLALNIPTLPPAAGDARRSTASASYDIGPTLGSAARTYLLVQGGVATALAAALLLAPGVMAGVWPWPITPLLTQLYAGPFLSMGLGSLLAARAVSWHEIRLAVIGIGFFALLVLVATFLHRSLFSVTRPATWVWVAAFTLVVCVHAALLIALRAERRAGIQ